MAFDLPSPKHLEAFLGQRFWRGAIAFGGGCCTVRCRLSTAFTPFPGRVTDVFQALRGARDLWQNEKAIEAQTKAVTVAKENGDPRAEEAAAALAKFQKIAGGAR